MKILIISPHYAPEQFKITAIAEYLAKNNDVDVWTNIPNYPKGMFYKGYGYFRRRKETINNVNIKRLLTIPRKKSVLFLGLNYLSFFISGYIKYIFCRSKYDIVLNYQLSPVYSAVPGILIGKKQKIPVVTYVLDLWPNSLLAIKTIKRTAFVFKKVTKHSKKIYQSSDHLFITSLGFKDYLLDMKINQNIHYIPNFAEDVFENQIIIRDLNLFVPKDKFKILFAGNIGKAQNLYSLIDIANEARVKNDTKRGHDIH